MKKGYKRTDEQNRNLSLKTKANWRIAAKCAEILRKNKDEVYNNIQLVKQNLKGLQSGNQDTINLVLKEGSWHTVTKVNGEVHKKRIPSQSDYVKSLIRREEIEKEKTGETPQEKYNSKKDDKPPLDNLKLIFWVIDKIGSLEKTEKLIEVAKMAIKVMEES